MIEITHNVIAGIPVLELVDSSLKADKLPLVVFYHGWDSLKENVLVNGYELAKRGFRAILPEALYHGERSDGQPSASHYLEFWKVVQQNIEEFPVLRDYYVAEKLADPERIGVTGLSMGGITTCGIVTTYPDFKAAVCLMGSPNATDFAHEIIDNALTLGYKLPADTKNQIHLLKPIDLASAPEKIAGRPFHFWHGTSDDMVPYQPTYDFYESIKEEDYARNVSFTTTADGHKVPYSISVEMADFFGTHL